MTEARINQSTNLVRVSFNAADIASIGVVDTDLIIVLKSGQRITLRDGALRAMLDADLRILFEDGEILASELLQQVGSVTLDDLSQAIVRAGPAQAVAEDGEPPVASDGQAGADIGFSSEELQALIDQFRELNARLSSFIDEQDALNAQLQRDFSALTDALSNETNPMLKAFVEQQQLVNQELQSGVSALTDKAAEASALAQASSAAPSSAGLLGNLNPAWGALGALGALGGAAGGGGSSRGGGGGAVSGVANLVVGGNIVLGPVISGNTLEVAAFDRFGRELGRDFTVEGGTGAFSITITGGYTGPIILKVFDRDDTRPDYVDEAKALDGDPDTLTKNLEGRIFTVALAPGTGAMTAHINPLTSIAAIKLLDPDTIDGPMPRLRDEVTAPDVANTNTAIAGALLGTSGQSIDTVAVSPVVDLDGNRVQGNLAGELLKAVSKLEAETGLTTSQAVSRLASFITVGPDGSFGFSGLVSGSGEPVDNANPASLTSIFAAAAIPPAAVIAFELGVDSGNGQPGTERDLITNEASQSLLVRLNRPLSDIETVQISTDGAQSWVDIYKNGQALSGWRYEALDATLIKDVYTLEGPSGSIGFRTLLDNTVSAPSVFDWVLDTQAPGAGFITGIALSQDTGNGISGTESDLRTRISSGQTITATLAAELDAGDILWGSVDAGATWQNITSKVSGTALVWDNVTLRGGEPNTNVVSAIRFYVHDRAGNNPGPADIPGTTATLAGSASYTVDTRVPNTSVELDAPTSVNVAADATGVSLLSGRVNGFTADMALLVQLFNDDGVVAGYENYVDITGLLVPFGGLDTLWAFNWTSTAALPTPEPGQYQVRMRALSVTGVSQEIDTPAQIASFAAPDALTPFLVSEVAAVGGTVVTNEPRLGVSGLAPEHRWEVALVTNPSAPLQWIPVTDTHFTLPDGSYGLGQIRVRQLNPADVAGPVTALSSPANLVIDTVAPTVQISDNAPDVTSGPVTFTFSFSESVTGFSADNINVTGGTPGAFSGSGAVYTLVVTPAANSTTPISVSTSTTGVTDAAGNTAVAPAAYSQAVDTVAPTVSTIEITGATGAQNGFLSAGDEVTITVTLSEAVTVTGTPQLALDIGGTTVQANYASGSGSNTLTFNYTILAGQNDANGIAVPANALTLNGGTIADLAGNKAVLTSTAVADNASFLVDTTPPTNTFDTAIYNASTDTFTLVGTNMLSITGSTGAVDKNLFDWDKFNINLGGSGVFTSITANDILSVTVDSDSRLSIKLTATKASTLENHAEWSVTTAASNSKITDILSISTGFTRDPAGNVAEHDANVALRFNTINLGTHQGGNGSGTWGGQSAGWLINPVLVNDNQLFYVWDRNANGTHGSGDTATFSGNLGLAAFMGKGASSNVTEDVDSRSFILNGIALRLPTDGNPLSTTVQTRSFPGTGIGNADRLLGDARLNLDYDDLLAIWDAFNGTGTGTGTNGAPSGWDTVTGYWSATPSGSGHAFVRLSGGVVSDFNDGITRYVAFELHWSDTTPRTVALANTTAGPLVNLAESTAPAGVVSVTAEVGATWTLTLTGQLGSVIKSGTGTGVAQAVTLQEADVTKLGQGAVTASLTATNTAGITATTSTGGNFTLATVPPAAPTLAEQGTDKLADGFLNISEAQTSTAFRVTFTGTGDAAAKVGDRVELLLNGAAFGTPKVATLTADNISAGHVNFFVSRAELGADGAKALTAVITDVAGNTPALSDAITFTLDTTITTPTLTLVDDTGTSDRITRNGAVNVSGLEANATWQYSLDGGITWIPGSGTRFTLTGDGIKSVIARQTDVAGNVSANSAVLSFTLDTTAPVFFSGNTATAVIGTSADTVIFDAHATDQGGAADQGITYTLVGANAGLFNIDANTGKVTYKTPPTQAGNLSFTVTATDAAGNADSKTVNLQVSAGPTTTLSDLRFSADTGASNSDFITNATVQTISAKLSDELAGGQTLWASLDGGANWIDVSESVSGTTLSWGVTLPEEVANKLQLQVRDTEGNPGVTLSQAYVIDTTPPDAPTLALGAGVSGSATFAQAISEGGVVTVTGEAGATIVVTFTRNDGESVIKTVTGTGFAQAVVLTEDDLDTLGNGTINVSATQTDAAGNLQIGAAATTSFTLNPPIFDKAIYNASTDTFTLVGTNMLTLTGSLGEVDKALFDWDKFNINLGGDGVFNSITANDIESVTVDSNSRLSIKLTATKATTLETHNEWSVTNAANNSKVTDVLSIEAGFARDAAGNVLGHDANDTLRFNTINLGTHQGGDGSGTWAGVNAGWLINPVLVNDNQIFYAWDRNASGTHGGGDLATFSGTNGLAAFMGKGASSNVTEDVDSRSFSINGIALRLPTDGNPSATVHVNPGPNAPGEPDFADGRDIYFPGQDIANATGAGGEFLPATGSYAAQGTDIGNGAANTAARLLGDASLNEAYDDLLAIWDAFNGSGQDNSVRSEDGFSWVSQVNGAPSGWGAGYWSATPSGSGHAGVGLTTGHVSDGNASFIRHVAFEVL